VARLFGLAGVLFAGTGVALGAFGAHALSAVLSDRSLETWRTAVDYQMIHALALIAVYLIWSHGSPDIAQANRWTRVGLKLAGWGFLIGVLLFSGSLYALSLGAGALFGPVTPVGGLSFLIGWTGLAIAIWYRGGEDVADDGVGDERMGQ
jgi:uncharacterized membrane protein YgdD (TMEM256/DUF423 family)